MLSGYSVYPMWVMQVVPGSVWGLVDEMLPATARLQTLGARIEVANLREQAQLEQRACLASSSAAIAAFASGVHRLDRSTFSSSFATFQLPLLLSLAGA